jgi:hypothetical protein
MNAVHFFPIEKVGDFAPNGVYRPTSSRRSSAGRKGTCRPPHWGEDPNQGAAR